MSSYFYSDPLAAAWMAKYFCIVFEQVEYLDGCAFLIPNGQEMPKKIYIHPDSLHLLDPQEGDLWIYPHPDTERGFWHITSKTSEPVPEGFICAQRNGISFMWPEHD